ncbi:hypothetical protein B0J11DRAFT_582501 [Dendryphion nanum]|uniref:Uncharacterized protein n=1 Tax=Dendryphion nanum TaxID=256645 RepID=A0A9P9IGQ6_9PLEO|nr:hypothetical protein B0J11DRAFT_582501 [Dendryphion nanum]
MPLTYDESKETALKQPQDELRESLEDVPVALIQGAESQNRVQGEKFENIHQWLSAPDPSTNYHKALKKTILSIVILKKQDAESIT